jgi:DNA-binding NarL/FixJ family response regulator
MKEVVMYLPYATSDGEQNSPNNKALVIIDHEPFAQECLVQAIRSALPHMPVIGISAVEELGQLGNVALVLLRSQSHPVSGHRLASEAQVLVQHCPDTPIVMLSMCTTADAIEEIIALGVRGVIPVTTSFKVAVAALQLVLVGGTYFPHLDKESRRDVGAKDTGEPAPKHDASSSHVTGRPYLTIVEQAGTSLEPDATEPNVTFTTREREVLEALQKGWSNKWIAHSLRISENTIKVHVQRIMRKLHATNRTEAVIRHRQLNGLR